MSAARKPLWAVVGALALSCQSPAPARPQWVVHVGTDAPLPGFGDRVRIDVYDGAGEVCEECSRVFEVGEPDQLPLSFGVVPDEDTATNSFGGLGSPPALRAPPNKFVRLRLYRAENTAPNGEPTEPVIDLYARLPALSTGQADGVVDVVANMTVGCFGKRARPLEGTTCDPATLDYPVELELPLGNDADVLASDTFAPTEPCVGDAPAGMVCVDGGLFLLGSRTFVPYGPDFDPIPEQLVELSPFFLDDREMSVGAYRALVKAGAPEPIAASAMPGCTYTAVAGPDDDMPVNCLARDGAALACAVADKRLPTEAEWEYAAGSRGSELAYPLDLSGVVVDNELLCSVAVLARGEPLDLPASRECALLGDYPVGPQRTGSPTDVTPFGLHDLAGNVSEWVADDFSRYDEGPCWGSDIVLRKDPRCDERVDGVLRGGSYFSTTYDAHTTFRQRISRFAQFPFVGFRCAKDAR
ncbi:MAG: formylglycine-generating enzyme family protein [Polyangiaceae bacterium]